VGKRQKCYGFGFESFLPLLQEVCSKKKSSTDSFRVHLPSVVQTDSTLQEFQIKKKKIQEREDMPLFDALEAITVHTVTLILPDGPL